LGIGDWGFGPIPQPQNPKPKTPNPKPQTPGGGVKILKKIF